MLSVNESETTLGQPDNMDGMCQNSGVLRPVGCTPGKSNCTWVQNGDWNFRFGWGEAGDINSSSPVGHIRRPLLPGPRKHLCSGNAILWNAGVEKEAVGPCVLQPKLILPYYLAHHFGGTQQQGDSFAFLDSLVSFFVNLFFTQVAG